MSTDRFKLDEFELYNVARAFRRKVYRLIRQLPSQETYCLERQMRKASVSITNNIAEGHGWWYFQENMRFCRIARGSTEETLDDLNTCEDESYGDQKLIEELKLEAYALIKRINGYISYLKKTKQGQSE